MTQENWLYVFVGSQGIFASKGYLAVSRGYLGKGYLGGDCSGEKLFAGPPALCLLMPYYTMFQQP